MSNDKVVRFFVSYAHTDEDLKNDFMERFKTFCQTSSRYQIELWDDGEILPGEKWHQEIQKNIKRSDFGLLLVSPAFLASKYITQNELPHFTSSSGHEGEKRVIPVGLKKISFNGYMDLKGLEEYQIFRYQNQKFYSQLRGRKDDFVNELFEKVIQLLDKALERTPSPRDDKGAEKIILANNPLQERDKCLSRIVSDRAKELGFPKEKFIPPKGYIGDLRSFDLRNEQYMYKEVDDALEQLMIWAKDKKGAQLCVILGECGMGKTTLSLEFTHALLEKRKNTPSLPLPIYFDLSLLGKDVRRTENIDMILKQLIEKNRISNKNFSISPEDVKRFVREKRGIIIFDGLDEVLVFLDEQKGREFIRELWSVVLGGTYGQKDPPPDLGRVLMTVRSHYFRTVRDQINYFLGQQREKRSSQNYLALLLLPFSEHQIRKYLKRSFPDEDPEEILNTIRSVHNLSELSQRPYTLELITNALMIKAWKLRGEPVSGAKLYDHVVNDWLDRDDRKSKLEARHRRLLMEHLSARLWRMKIHSWHIDEMEKWLMDFIINKDEDIKSHYGISPPELRERFRKDLRTATFLVREDNDLFRFAHTSLQDFFLASYLFKSLEKGDFTAWDLPCPSVEVYDFLAQLWEDEDIGLEKKEILQQNVAGFKKQYQAHASENLFIYLLYASKKGYIHAKDIPLAGFNLQGARLKGIKIKNYEDGYLFLNRIDFSEADLTNSIFKSVNLDGALFKGAYLERAQFLSCRAVGANFQESNLKGCIFRQCTLHNANFSDASLHRTKWLGCSLKNPDDSLVDNNRYDKTFFGACKDLSFKPVLPDDDSKRLFLKKSHYSNITALTSLDKMRFASADSSGIINIWDAVTGEKLVEVKHKKGIINLCYLGKGRLAAAGYGYIHIWNIDTEEKLLTIEHKYKLTNLSYLGEDRLATAGWDGYINVWNIETGENLLEIQHEEEVRALSYLGEGRLAAAGCDGHIHIWDIDMEEKLLTIEHKYKITTFSYLGEGRLAVAGGWDGHIHIWDIETGEKLLKFQHGNKVIALSYLGEGRLATASEDKLFRNHYIRLWNIKTEAGEKLLEIKHGYRKKIEALSYLGEGRLATAEWDGYIHIWNIESGKKLLEIKHGYRVIALSYLGEGRLAAAGWDNRHIYHLWDIETGEKLLKIDYRYRVIALSYLGEGKLAIAGKSELSGDNSIHFWNIKTGKKLLEIKHEEEVRALSYLGEGRLATAGWDGYINVWNIETGKKLLEIKHEEEVRALSYLGEGRLATAGWDGDIYIWNIETWEKLLEIKHEEEITTISYLGKGKLAAAGLDGIIKIWDTKTGRLLKNFYLSPDGELICFSDKSLLFTSSGGWRHLFLQDKEPQTARIRTFPYEMFNIV